MELKNPVDTLLEDMMHQAVTDAALFRTYDGDYEVIDRDQVMRCLANLDDGIKLFNKIATKAQFFDKERTSIDAIFTALRIMQDKLKSAVEHEAEKVIESRNEMKAFGEEA